MVKQSQAWKDLERKVAKKLGGKRIVRGNDYSISLLDVEHDWLALDAKWRTSLAVVTWYNKLVSDNDKIYGKGNKIPILVIKRKGMKGELVVIALEDFIRVVNEESFYIKSEEN